MIEQIRRASSELAAICLRHNVRMVDLFGSAVGADFDHATSDLDFLVEFGPFPKGGYSERYFCLIDDLTGLFGRSWGPSRRPGGPEPLPPHLGDRLLQRGVERQFEIIVKPSVRGAS